MKEIFHFYAKIFLQFDCTFILNCLAIKFTKLIMLLLRDSIFIIDIPRQVISLVHEHGSFMESVE